MEMMEDTAPAPPPAEDDDEPILPPAGLPPEGKNRPSAAWVTIPQWALDRGDEPTPIPNERAWHKRELHVRLIRQRTCMELVLSRGKNTIVAECVRLQCESGEVRGVTTFFFEDRDVLEAWVHAFADGSREILCSRELRVERSGAPAHRPGVPRGRVSPT
jgi:hypothetical protein